MSNEKKDNERTKIVSASRDQRSIHRRNLLLGTSTLVAAATLTSGVLVQTQKAAPSASALALAAPVVFARQSARTSADASWK